MESTIIGYMRKDLNLVNLLNLNRLGYILNSNNVSLSPWVGFSLLHFEFIKKTKTYKRLTHTKVVVKNRVHSQQIY